MNRSNPNVMDTINSVATLIKLGLIEMHPINCKHSCASMRNYKFKKGTKIPDKSTGFDHHADCIRYVGHKLLPANKQETVEGNLGDDWTQWIR